MDRDELRAVGKRALDLNLADHLRHAFHHRLGRENRRSDAHDLGDRLAVAYQLQDFRRDERDCFGMIELDAAIAPLPRELAGGEDEELVDFSRREMHRSSDPARDIITYSPYPFFIQTFLSAAVAGGRRPARTPRGLPADSDIPVGPIAMPRRFCPTRAVSASASIAQNARETACARLATPRTCWFGSCSLPAHAHTETARVPDRHTSGPRHWNYSRSSMKGSSARRPEKIIVAASIAAEEKAARE